MDVLSIFFRTDWKSILQRITEMISGQFLRQLRQMVFVCFVGNPAWGPLAFSQQDEPPAKQLSLEDLEARLRKRQKEEKDRQASELPNPAPPRSGLRLDGTSRERPKTDGNPEKADAATVREAAPTLESDSALLGQKLQLSDVIASTYRAFPLLEIARLESGIAAGQQVTALGAYDTKLEYYSLNQPVGFYETYRNGIGVARQLWWGGYASAGYKMGRGDFQPWYKERLTNSGGEFTLALVQPLLQGRAIDPQRVELFQANLRRQAVGPEIQYQVLTASQDAARSFWQWVEAGNVLKAQDRLLEIAVKRGEQLDRSLAAGAASNLDVSQNAQQIYDRQFKVNDTRQKFRDAAFKLAMFLRDEAGSPLLVPPEWLPEDFPEITSIPPGDFDRDFQNALASRPELTLINLDVQSLRWDLTLARNQMLPNVDMTLQTTQNMGRATLTPDVKGEFQLEAGVMGGVPIQRRKAIGKIQSAEAKLNQLSQKFEFQRNKIEMELRTFRNALDIAQQNVATSRELLKQANITLAIFKKANEAGEVDLFFLLNQEIKVNDSEVKLLEAERAFFTALAAMQAALGLDPLEQATLLLLE